MSCRRRFSPPDSSESGVFCRPCMNLNLLSSVGRLLQGGRGTQYDPHTAERASQHDKRSALLSASEWCFFCVRRVCIPGFGRFGSAPVHELVARVAVLHLRGHRCDVVGYPLDTRAQARGASRWRVKAERSVNDLSTPHLRGPQHLNQLCSPGVQADPNTFPGSHSPRRARHGRIRELGELGVVPELHRLPDLHLARVDLLLPEADAQEGGLPCACSRGRKIEKEFCTGVSSGGVWFERCRGGEPRSRERGRVTCPRRAEDWLDGAEGTGAAARGEGREPRRSARRSGRRGPRARPCRTGMRTP